MPYRLLVSGELACFPRPEIKHDRISYDVITPFAARGIFEAIYWKPGMRWWIDAIEVLRPIRFSTPAPAPARGAGSRPARRMLALQNVAYVIEAHFDAEDATAAPGHAHGFLERARTGTHFRQPYLGLRDFPATARLVENDEPASDWPASPPRDLGWMLHDLATGRDEGFRFYRPRIVDGRITVPAVTADEVAM